MNRDLETFLMQMNANEAPQAPAPYWDRFAARRARETRRQKPAKPLQTA